MLDLRQILESQGLVETMLGVFYFLKMISTQMDIENINLYTGLQLSHIVYISDFWNIEWGAEYGCMLLGFYDINNSANIPYPHTIPTRAFKA